MYSFVLLGASPVSIFATCVDEGVLVNDVDDIDERMYTG